MFIIKVIEERIDVDAQVWIDFDIETVRLDLFPFELPNRVL